MYRHIVQAAEQSILGVPMHIVQAAEQQMRRSAPDEHTAKRRKVDGDSRQGVARYNYTSMESLVEGAEGFIVTCPFRKEKSATREAITMLSTYLDQDLNAQQEPASTHSSPDAGTASIQPHAAHNSAPPDSTQTPTRHPAYSFSMTKLASSGIVMLQLLLHTTKQGIDTDLDAVNQLPPCTSKQGTDAVNSTTLSPVSCAAEAKSDGVSAAGPSVPNCRPAEVVQKMLDDVQAGKLTPPVFCERIMPVQLTCAMTAQALKAAASRVAALHAGQAVKAAAGLPVKLAVAYKGRGSGGKHKNCAVDRAQAIAIVADAAESAITHCGGSAQVDLNSPQAVMMVEVLPITPNPICALCWLPGSMIQARKLLVKPLVAPEQLKQADKQAS